MLFFYFTTVCSKIFVTNCKFCVFSKFLNCSTSNAGMDGCGVAERVGVWDSRNANRASISTLACSTRRYIRVFRNWKFNYCKIAFYFILNWISHFNDIHICFKYQVECKQTHLLFHFIFSFAFLNVFQQQEFKYRANMFIWWVCAYCFLFSTYCHTHLIITTIFRTSN